MSQGSCNTLRRGAIVAKQVAQSMKITLHIGAHRTATTCFQKYMHLSKETLHAQDVEFWGPQNTRTGLFTNVYNRINGCTSKIEDQRSVHNLSRQLENLRRHGVQNLIVSEENILGSTCKNVREGSLYRGAGDRLAHFAEAFDGTVTSVVISPRSLDVFWCSSLAYAVANGLAIPNSKHCAKIARGFRGWRDVVADIATALPGVEIKVLPFESFAGRPDRFLMLSTGVFGPVCKDRSPVNASPRLPELRRAMLSQGKDTASLPFGMGRWNPFTNEQHSALRELFADDMMWLTAGADGLATLIEDRDTTQAGNSPPRVATKKGQFDEFEERRMARPG